MAQQANIEEIVETLSGLSVLDLSKLKKALEEKWDVKAAAGGAVMMAATPVADGGSGSVSAEPTEFQVVLEEVPADKKIATIKAIREITGLPLKEAKDLADSAPKPIKDRAPKAEAEDIQKKLTEAGAKATLKGL